MANIEMERAVPTRLCEDGIIEEYLKYTIGQESPQDFHLWVIITCLAIILGRNSYVDMGAWKTYPNLFTILVGESALTHKGTAMKYGLKVLGAAAPKLNEVAQKFSPESLSNLLKQLSEGEGKRAEAHIISPELSVLLGNSRLDDSLLKLLTDLWDSPDMHKYMTLSRGMEKATDVCINMLAGSTPSWLKNSVPEESLEGGFFSRLILVDRPPTGVKIPFPDISLASKMSMDKVIHDLKVIRNTFLGPFTLTPQAKMVYGEWYSTYNKPEKAVSFMRGYYGRKGDFVLKLAMVSSANFSNSMKISDEDVLFAIGKLNENEEHTKNLVKFLGTTQDGKKYTGILARIKKSVVDVPKNMGAVTREMLASGEYEKDIRIGIDHSALMRSVGYQMKAQDLSDVIDALIQAEEIQMIMIGAKKIYLAREGE